MAIPNTEYQELAKHREFLSKVSKSSERPLGLLDTENLGVFWFAEEKKRKCSNDC